LVKKNRFIFILIYFTMSEYELVKNLGSYDNFKGLKSMAKVLRHKLFARNINFLLRPLYKLPAIQIRVNWVSYPIEWRECFLAPTETEMWQYSSNCIEHKRPRAAGLLWRAEEMKERIYHVIKGCNCLLKCDV
jgi:hypothetical protein